MNSEVLFLGKRTKIPSDMALTLEGFHFKLGILMEDPFIIKDTTGGCVGNNCYTGYCIDLVMKLAEDLHFNYTFVEPPDYKWGGYNPYTEQWNGLVKQLIDKDIDMATVHLSINSLREKYIDFSVPFMDAGLMAVVRGESRSANKFFFLSPFSRTVWYCILLASCIVTVFVCFMNKVSPFGKYGGKMHALMTCSCYNCCLNRQLANKGYKSLTSHMHYKCLLDQVDAEPRNRLENLSLYNSSWLVNSALLSQSPVEGGPYCASGRFVVMAWWFFMMIMSAMYTANLAAALTVNRLHVGLQSVEDLLKQDDFEWGTVPSTNPEILMKNSIKPEYKTLMKLAHSVNNASTGFKKVEQMNFAFIYETPFLEYNLQLNCDIIKIGDEFSKFGLAFGLQHNAPFADVINHMILKYRELGILDVLWERWLHADNLCAQTNSHAQGITLDMSSLAGLFVALGACLVISVIVVIAEVVYAAMLDAYGNNLSETFNQPHTNDTINKSKSKSSKFCRCLMIRLSLLQSDFVKHWWSSDTYKSFRKPVKLHRESSTQTNMREKSNSGGSRRRFDVLGTRRKSLPSTDNVTITRQYNVCVSNSLGSDLNYEKEIC